MKRSLSCVISTSQSRLLAGFLDAILAIHLSILFGLLLNDGLKTLGLELPLFVSCLFAGLLLTNLIPANFPSFSGMRWPSRTPSMALIADVALGTFLAMSLMSMQLWPTWLP